MREREILRLTRRLGRVEPDAESSDAAKNAVRAALIANHRTRRRRWIIMTSGLAAAAAAVIAVSVALMVSTSRQASAAERLNEVEQVNAAYVGWVHLTSSSGGDEKRQQPGGLHFNTADGTWVEDSRDADGKRKVTFWRPTTSEEVLYDGAANEIRIGALNENFARNWTTMIREYPLTLSGIFAMVRKVDPNPPSFDVTEKNETGLTRFDVTAFKRPATATAAAASTAPSGPQRLTVWADPKTKLIRKLSTIEDGQTTVVTYTYGDPQIKEIYDVGVPRDAKVIDARPSADAKAVLDRLDQRARKGHSGDGVMLVIEYDLDAKGQPDMTVGQIELHAEDGGGTLVNRYAVGATSNPMTKPIATKLPRGWPDPKLADALEVLRGATPMNFLVLPPPGDHGWQGFLQPDYMGGGYHVNTLSGNEVQTMRARFGVGASPSRDRLGLFGAGSQVKVEPAENQLVALHVEQAIWDGQGEMGDAKHTRHATQVFVIDPSRDDLTVRSTSTSIAGNGQREYDFEIVCLEPAQLPDGQWYPSRTRVTSYRAKGTGREVEYVQERRVRIFPGEKLDATWFVQPALPAK